MNLALYFLLVVQLHRLTLTSASDASESPMMLPSAACTDELVIFSSCLPFIGASPNTRTEFPPPQCCDDISSAFANGSAICICYLILQPEILGFPLNSTKLLSLTSLCPRTDQNSEANFSLQKLCSDSAVLPPLHSITGSNNQKPHNATVAGIPPPQESSGGITSTESAESSGIPSTEQPADESPYQESSSIPSSATNKIYCMSCVAFFLLLCFSICQRQSAYK